MAEHAARVVHVKIYDREYALRTADPDRLVELARQLDARMRATAESTGTVDTLKVAIHAALGLADELMRARDELESVNQRSLECTTLLERALH